MVHRRSWQEFRQTGLLWFINTTLHMFGWAIVVELDDALEVINAYPARVKFRGFSTSINDEGYNKVTQYMKNNYATLHQECTDDK